MAAQKPSTYDFWSASARTAYDEMEKRALAAEARLERIRANFAQGIDTSLTPPDDTLTWQMAIMSTINKLLHEAASTLDPSKIFESVTQTLCFYLDATSTYVCDYDPLQQTYTVLHEHISAKASGNETIPDLQIPHPISDDFNQHLNRHETYVMQHPFSETSYDDEHFHEYDVKTVLIASLKVDGKPIGFLEIWDTQKERQFTEHQINFVVTIASQIAGSVQMAALHRNLSESEARYRTLMDALPDGVVQVDRFGHILYINPQFRRMVHQHQPDLINQPLDDVWKQVAKLTDVHQEYVILNADGFQNWIQVKRVPLTQGEVVIFTDVTQRKEAEMMAIHYGIEQERTHLLAKFIQDASHEFYTPLSVINTRLYMLERKGDSEQELAAAKVIGKQVDIITNLVKSLEEITRLDATDTITMYQYDMVSLVHDTIAKLTNDRTSVAQTITFDSEEQLLINCNPKILSQALYNILDNAVRYTDDNGEIQVKIRTAAQKVELSIIDSGIGIASQHLELIFGRFYRVDVARTTRGFGLGLPIAKRAIELHGGKILVESEVEQGTTFTLILPLSPDA